MVTNDEDQSQGVEAEALPPTAEADSPDNALPIEGAYRPDRRARTERRSYPRYLFTTSSEIVDLASGAQCSARTSDISLGGCFVDATSPFPTGTVVKVRLTKDKSSFVGQTYICRQLVEVHGSELPVRSLVLTREDFDHLDTYPWPGNIRELENCLRQAMILGSLSAVSLGSDASCSTHHATREMQPGLHPIPLDELERNAIEDALELAHGDKLLAASWLGIGKTTLYRKLKRYQQSLSHGGAEEAAGKSLSVS